MKDYSQFINGFITKYIIENNEILIYTANMKEKDEPQKVPATKENIKYFEQRLEKQYKMVIKHQDEIVEYKRNRKRPLEIALTAILVVTQLMLLILFGTCTLTQISLGIIIATGLLTNHIINKEIQKFKKELKQYATYIEHKQQIEKTSEQDKNITAYLNQETLSKIEENKKLKQNGLIDSIYNIDLMDKISLEELKKILLRYKISKSLYEEQVFRIPSNSIQNNQEEQIYNQQKYPKSKYEKKKCLTPSKQNQTEEPEN